MCLARTCAICTIVAVTVLAGTAAVLACQHRRIDTRDSEFRLMAMLYLSCATR